MSDGTRSLQRLALCVDETGDQPLLRTSATISVDNLTLEGGDASAANQVTGNNLLTDIKASALLNQAAIAEINTKSEDLAVIAGNTSSINTLATESTVESILTALASLATQATLATASSTLTTISNRVLKPTITQIKEATDYTQTFTYDDAGTDNERVASITHASATVGASILETYAYAGASGSYRVSSITRSLI